MGDHIKLKSNRRAIRTIHYPLRPRLGFVFTTLAALILVCWSGPVTFTQQGPPSDIAGRYEGFAESKNYGRVPLVADIRQQGSIIAGSLHTPLGDFSITDASYKNGRLTFKAESYDDEGIIAVAWNNDRFVGEFEGFGDKGIVELRRTGPPAPVVDTTPTDNLSKDEWREDLRYLASELPRRHAN